VTAPEDPTRPANLTAQEWEALRRLQAEAGAAEPPPTRYTDTPLAPAKPDRTSAPSRARRTTSAVVSALAVLTVLVVAAAAMLALTTARVSQRRTATSDRLAALATAVSAVPTVLSYNYKHLAADFAAAEANLTPAFRKTYVKTTADAVQPLAAKYHAISSAQVTSGGVVSQHGGSVEVLVFVAQQVTNTQLAAPRLDRSRIDVVLVHHGGRWLIDKLTPV
jgi:Mce-associated membrane protein